MRVYVLAIGVALLAVACGDSGDDVVDQDGDGVPAGEDCDDSDATVNPMADEVCDGLDNDCDGEVDEDATDATTWYADEDGDGYGDSEQTEIACEQPEDAVAEGGDCDDEDDAINPGAEEICDGVDNNCDGEIDEGATSTYYADADGDGFGDPETTIEACDAPEGYVEDSNDCDDENPAVNPDAEEICDDIDNNCDGTIIDCLPGGFYLDSDGDGFGDPDRRVDGAEAPPGYVEDNTDCDDTDPSINPDADEVCDGLDNDCDGEVDEEVAGAPTWYEDGDGDGFGNPDVTTEACAPPEGYVDNNTDCDDADPGANPEAEEICDGADNDCDGEADEADAVDASTWYADADADGFGDPETTVEACSAPEGYVADGTDCDDSDGAINPEAEEICDGADNDCDGETDEEGLSTFYADDDGDGYGDPEVTTESCGVPEGYVADDRDCDDTDGAINPEADEVCDGADNDCDGETDEADAIDAPTWYADSDGDEFGDPETSERACSAPEGYVADDRDCDDTDEAINPAADEVCDELDNDCDSEVDEDPVDGAVYYPDADGDGYGGPDGVRACAPPSPDYVEDSTDCDDDDPRSHPEAVEICDEADNDCDDEVDDDCVEVILIEPPTADHVEDPERPGVCGYMGEMTSAPTSWRVEDLPAYMDMLDGHEPGLTDAAIVEGDVLDFSIRCGGDYLASPGNYTDTTIPWPELDATGSYGGARIRGYINIGPDDPLNYTLGLIGNDALTLVVEGELVVWVNWADGRWKKFRYISFPGPGLYAFEVQWLTNLICDIDPFELVWAEGFVPDYHNYDTMCSYGSCVYNNGRPIPGFEVIGSDHLAQSTDGSATDCVQCFAVDDCGEGETCNSAGICQ